MRPVPERLAEVLRCTGELLLERRRSGRFTFRRDASSVSASVDVEAHQQLVAALSALTPRLPVLSEEDPTARGAERPDEYWLVDPLDGTASFVDGYEGFVTQAALMRKGKAILAGVFAPALAQMFLAERGAGAVRDGARLSVGPRAPQQWTLTDNYPTPRGVAAQLMRDWNLTSYLECGSIGLKICRIADASAHIFVKDVVVRDWDVAAPQLVLEEAGGYVTDAAGHAFEYAGAYEHRGLVACASAAGAERVVDWLRRR